MYVMHNYIYDDSPDFYYFKLRVVLGEILMYAIVYILNIN